MCSSNIQVMFKSLITFLLAAYLAACSTNRLNIITPTSTDPTGVLSKFDKEEMYRNCTHYGGLNEESIYSITADRWRYMCEKHPSLQKQKSIQVQNEKPAQVKSGTINLKDDLKSIRTVCADSTAKSDKEELEKCVELKIKRLVSNVCLGYGGVNEESIKKMSNHVWSYKCRKGPDILTLLENYKKTQSPTVNLSGDIKGAMQRCTDLGFKTGTEDFGKCVLQLSK